MCGQMIEVKTRSGCKDLEALDWIKYSLKISHQNVHFKLAPSRTIAFICITDVLHLKVN